MEINNYEKYKEVKNRIENTPKEYKEIASQMINDFYEKKLTTCEAKVILGLCNDILEFNSNIIPIVSSNKQSYVERSYWNSFLTFGQSSDFNWP